MAKNENLHKAKDAKKDEFYTQYEDIQNELNHYEQHFRGKTVLCNCDDPFESNFCKFFLRNFNYLGLKRLICTSYGTSPVVGQQLSLFDDENEPVARGHGYVMDIREVPMANGRGVSDEDIDALLKSKRRGVKKLKGDGDFRSEECIEYLKQADIVVTNPPFSLFREYVAQLMEYDKKFLIIGNKNAITYKEIFPLIKDNKLWLGYGFRKDDAYFRIPLERATGYAPGVYNPATGLVHFRNCTWFTNLDTAASKSWRIPQGSPSSPWEGVSKFHYPPRCHRARFAESGLRLRRSLGWLFRNHLLEAIVVAAHLMPLSRGFCACIMVYSVFNVR